MIACANIELKYNENCVTTHKVVAKRYRKEKLLKVVFYFQQMEDCISVKTFQAHNKKLNRLVANVDRVFISIDFITRQRFHYQQYKQ